MKRFFVLILAVLGLLAIGQNDSKAQGFSITFGGGPAYYDRITAAAITIRDIITTIDRIIIAPTTIAVTAIIIVDTTGGIIGRIAIDHPFK